jgi:hypothetical protein
MAPFQALPVREESEVDETICENNVSYFYYHDALSALVSLQLTCISCVVHGVAQFPKVTTYSCIIDKMFPSAMFYRVGLSDMSSPGRLLVICTDLYGQSTVPAPQ